jgi:uroporphyrinogen decarboxylase
MAGLVVPLKAPKPDIGRFLDAVSGRKVPDKPPLEEYIVDNALMRPILEGMLGRTWVQSAEVEEFMGGQMELSRENRDAINAKLDNQVAFWYHMGYDYVRVEVSLALPARAHVTKDTATGNESHNRAWQGLEPGVIQSWEDFEKYPWPRVTEQSFYMHHYICDHLPDGLGFITCHAGGVFEHVSRLMGYEGICYALYDNPGLLTAVTDKLGELIYQYNTHLMQLDKLAVLFQGEDFGFNTQTLIPPDAIRKYFLTWHKKYAQMAHAAKKPYYLHSCGNLDDIMKDLVEDVGIDAKHSFQDNVKPIWDYKAEWGDRIGLLGGIDLNKLTSCSPEELRRYVRQVIDRCAPGGRFAVGAGNSVPSYVPVVNYLTMLDEALR